MAAPAHIARENGKKGGRPKGKKTKAIIEREIVLRAYRERVASVVPQILDAQLTLARGQTYLYKIEKELIVGPKGGKSYRKKKPELVTSQFEIEQFLENKIGNTYADDSGPEATYYFLTTKDPDNQAINSMMDRTFGRAVQAIEIDPSKDDSLELFSDEQLRKMAAEYSQKNDAK